MGGEDGELFRSTDDGLTWRAIGGRDLRRRDRPVEAIAVDPTDSRTIYVGLAGPPGGVADPGFLFKTGDAGTTWVHVGAQVADTAGAPVSVNALEIDPAAHETVFAGTDIGVFRSTDAGSSWQPFDEGLPNVRIRDLAFVPQTRTLRAGAWGRGTFERHVGDRPPRDVHLYVRASELDDGSVRPAPRGPAGYATAPAPTPVAETPDIKNHRDRPAQIGPDEQVDGVEFDEEIAHEDPVRRPANLFVQVHNRGSFPADGVRVTALWADATNGPPPLPEDFWARFAAAPPLAGSLEPWTLISDDAVPAANSVESGVPRVRTLRGELAGRRSRRGAGSASCVLISCPDDALAGPELDIADLLAAHPKAAYREARTRRTADDHRLFLRRTGATQFSVAPPPRPRTRPRGARAGRGPDRRAGGRLGAVRPRHRRAAVRRGQHRAAAHRRPVRAAGAAARRRRRRGDRVRPGDGDPQPGVRPGRLPGSRRARAGRGAAARQLPLRHRRARRRRHADTARRAGGAGGRRVRDARARAGGPVARVQGGLSPYTLHCRRGADIPVVPPSPTVPRRASRPPPASRPATSAPPSTGRPRQPDAGACGRAAGRPLDPPLRHRHRRPPGQLPGGPPSPTSSPSRRRRCAAPADLFGLVRRTAPTARGRGRQLPVPARRQPRPRDAAAGRHRLFQLDMSVTPITAAPIAATVTEDVPAVGTASPSSRGTPARCPRATGVRARRRRPRPRPAARSAPGFASLQALDDFCDANPNAAYREFTVGP